MRVGFARDRIRQMRDASRMRRRAPSGETRYGQVETAPEEMDWAAFATELRTELLEDAVALQKHAPETVRVFRVVSGILFVFLEGNRGIDFVRRRVDLNRQFENSQCVDHLAVERRD